MSWPLSHEFNEAIQMPRVAFADPELRGAEAVVGATGLPLPRSGNFADVYQLRGPGGREWAVKCFTRPAVGLAERYARVGEALAGAGLPFTIPFQFLAEGIRVGGAWRPVVKMEWVEGLLLNQVARDGAGKPAVLLALGQIWARLCKRLREAGVAHADLQHGNALLVPGSRPGAFGVKLIDYDGLWVPALANTPSGESGHPSYQHPARAASRAYSPDVDRFPHLVIATALRGLSAGGAGLWERYDNGDNMLFTEADFKRPAQSKLMRELWEAGDPAVRALAGRLAVACGKPIPQTPWLDQVAPEGEPLPLDEPTRREAMAALGIPIPVPIPLPPEPAYEVVEQAPAVSPPVAPASVPAPEPEEVDVELVEVPSEPRKKGRRPGQEQRPKKRSAAGGKTPLILLGGGGLLLLVVGAVVAAAALGGRSKPTEAAQHKEEPKPAPVVPVAAGPKPKEKGQELPPAPKIETPVRVQPPQPLGPLTSQQTWLEPLPDSNFTPMPVCGRDGRTVLFHFGKDVYIFDLESRKRLPVPSDPSQLSTAPAALDGGRFFSSWVTKKRLPVWDPREARVVQELPVGDLMPTGLAYSSPTGKYVAASTSRGEGNEDAFRLKVTASGAIVLDLKWFKGHVYFTDDESRVLLAESTGQCRWYKLPKGELDAEWTIPKKVAESPHFFGVKAASGDGSVLVYVGSMEGRPQGVYVLDGATGKVRVPLPVPGPFHHAPTISRTGASFWSPERKPVSEPLRFSSTPRRAPRDAQSPLPASTPRSFSC